MNVLCWGGRFYFYQDYFPFLFPWLFDTGLILTFMISHVMIGPFKINGVPLRRVNQSYVIATSTKVDISTVDVEKFDDKYFAKEAEKKKNKGEAEFFEAEKEVSCLYILIISH